MNTKKTDRRVKYTKMDIRESFVKILKQKPISKISIKEICEDADINRATFYAHYTDQYDLLKQIENELIDGINQYLAPYNFRKEKDAPVEMIIKILEFIQENSVLFDLLLNSNGDINFQKEVTNLIGRQHFYSYDDKAMLRSEDDEYIFLFFANGCLGVIQKWLADGGKKPIEEVARLILQLSINGSAAFDWQSGHSK